MFRDITVLIVIADYEFAEALDRKLSAQHFVTRRATSMWDAVREFEGADLLALSWALPNGNSAEVLDYWTRRDEAGPVLILSETTLDPCDVNALLTTAWNVVCAPFNVTEIGEIMERYAWIVRGAKCCREVGKLKRQLYALYLIVAALGGTQFVLPLVRNLLGG